VKYILTLIIVLLGCSSNDDNESGGCPNATIDGSNLSCGGQTYKTVKIGEHIWMAENLNYNAEGSECYDGEEANCNKYGRLYDWETAQTVCPKGWHLPSIKDEWDRLIHSVSSTNDSGFSALLGGYGDPDGYFYNVGYDGCWWSSTVDYRRNSKIKVIKDTISNAYNIHYNAEGIRKREVDKTYLFSVRCIKPPDGSKEAKTIIDDIIFCVTFLSFGSFFIFAFLHKFNMMGKKTREEMMNTSEFIIRQPKAFYMFFFCVALVGWSCIIVLIGFSITGVLIFLFYSLICILSSISYFRWKVIVKGNQITFTPHLGKTKSFTFSDITDVKRRIDFLWSKYGEYIKIYYSIEDKQSSFSVHEGDLCYYTLVSRLEEEDIYY